MGADKETWVEIEEFPGYAVSSWGRVMNTETDLIKKATVNQAGIPNVLLMRDGEQFRRSVAVLVANHFLDKPDRIAFDTPINLDGDRCNNRADNLAWRPRWFAMRYHQQFQRGSVHGFKGGIMLADEVFDDVRECAKAYGLLESELITCAQNKTPIFPTWQTVQMV